MNIKIVICFIIICLLPVASADTGEVWVAKYSGFIKSGQPVSFENYLITPKTLDSMKAAITVHKNQAQIETREFNVNDFKKYDTIGISLLGITGDYSWISISKLETGDIWRPLARTRLKWGEVYSAGNYTFNIDTFGSNSVSLVISNKSMEQTNAFSIDEPKDYGNIRIAVRDINRTGFIELESFTNMAPAIKAEVLTDKTEYFPDEPILATVNTSSDFVQNIVGIVIETNPVAEIQPETFTATGITTRSFQSKITRLPANSTVTINAKIETRDYYNNAYITTASKSVFITPEVSIIKSAPVDTDDENVTVQLYVYNSGPDNKSVHIRDAIPEEITAKELNWDNELGSKKSITLTYNVTPQKPGLYILPAARVQWSNHSAVSKRVNLAMHLPFISMIKTAVTNKNQTDVKLAIRNIGDRPALVKASDKIPKGYSLAGGNAAWYGKLEGGESTTVMYSLEGSIETLPAADATYRDIRGVTRHVQSNTVEPGTKDVNVINDKKAPTLKVETYDIMSFMISSFIAIVGIIAGVTLIIYLLTTLQRRK